MSCGSFGIGLIIRPRLSFCCRNQLCPSKRPELGSGYRCTPSQIRNRRYCRPNGVMGIEFHKIARALTCLTLGLASNKQKSECWNRLSSTKVHTPHAHAKKKTKIISGLIRTYAKSIIVTRQTRRGGKKEESAPQIHYWCITTTSTGNWNLRWR